MGFFVVVFLLQVGIATSLSAFLQLNELSDEEEEEDDLLKEGTN